MGRTAYFSPVERPRRKPPEVAGLAVDTERVGLSAVAVKRGHQLPAQALAVRVLGDERLLIGNDLALAN